MSTTPPKKGKKRSPPPTPTGRPPANTSRASSPTPHTGDDAPTGLAHLFIPSAPPAISPSRQPSGGPSALPTGHADVSSQRGGEESMAADEEEGAPTPPATTVSFATVEEDMDDEEAESSFKELTDWMRYLGQHKGRRGQLTTLLIAAVENLRALSGETGGKKPASYAEAAATSAPQPNYSTKPRPAQTARQSRRQIKHAITQFERVSKELPRAPRDMLLNIVARSDLKTAPPPLPKVPGPKKRASCLVKGILNNTLAFCVPDL